MNKLWSKQKNINSRIESFTIGKDAKLDERIARYDILGSMAHAIMLQESEIITAEDLENLLSGLNQLLSRAEAAELTIEEGIEDIHSYVEMQLTDMIGEAGKKLHTARSRNDQILVDLKLYYREYLSDVAGQLEQLIHALLDRAGQYKEVLMPGYTHMQVAMPSSFGLWFGGYGETLIHDFAVLKNTIEIVNHNPLGSAAGYGSSFPVRRARTTELLGFSNLEYNVIAASMNRGKTEFYLASALAGIGTTLGKFCMDICLYNSQNYGFLILPEEYTTGSSIMPHKKNPDVFELLRAKFNQIILLPQEINAVIQNLPTGYHRDYQLLKEIMFDKMNTVTESLDILIYVIDKIEVKENLMKDPLYAQAFSVEMIKEKVDSGIPFRDAYLQVKDLLERGLTEIPALNHTHEGSIGSLNIPEIRRKLEKIKERYPDYDFEAIFTRLRNHQV